MTCRNHQKSYNSFSVYFILKIKAHDGIKKTNDCWHILLNCKTIIQKISMAHSQTEKRTIHMVYLNIWFAKFQSGKSNNSLKLRFFFSSGEYNCSLWNQTAEYNFTSAYNCQWTTISYYNINVYNLSIKYSVLCEKNKIHV